MQRSVALSLQFSFRTTFRFPSFLNTVDPCVLRTGMEVADSRHKAFSKAGSFQLNLHLQGRKAWSYSSSPRHGQPSLPQGRAPLRSMQSANSGPHRAEPARQSQQPLEPSQPGWAWAPAATAPPTRPLKERCAPPVTLAPDLPATECGIPGQRPRAGGRAPRRPESLPGTPSILGGVGRGERPGGCHRPAQPVARVAGTWLSP